MKFKDLYNSVFAILRVENQNATVAGTGFLIRKNPLYLLTCNHVVGEATQDNNGNIRYFITKRTDNFDAFDLRTGQISYLRCDHIVTKPELDLAVLRINPQENPGIFNTLGLHNAPALDLSFDPTERQPGAEVEWLSTAATGDLTLTPRFFKGNLIIHYRAKQNYQFKNNQNQTIIQEMDGVDMIEVDKLFIPGSSGSPILDIDSNKVIAYVHGFRAWPIPTNTKISQQVEFLDGTDTKNITLRYDLPLQTSLSLGIDIRNAELYLRERNFI